MDLEAAQQELDGLTQGESTQDTAKPDTEYYELPVGDQVYKIPLNHEFEVKHSGQTMRVPLEKLFNAYRQQAHVEDKFKELNQNKAQLEEQRNKFKNFDDLHQKYGAIQKWSEEHPEDWQRLWDMYQSKEQHLLQGNGEDQNQALIQEIMNLKKELSDYRDFKSKFEKTQEEKEIQEDMQEIQKQIEEIKAKHPQINLEEKDVEGVTFQARVINHGLEKGYPDFHSAFYTHPDVIPRLLETADHAGRNETVKAVKEAKRAGVVERSDKPFVGQGQFDPTKLSDDQLKEGALAELEKLMGQ